MAHFFYQSVVECVTLFFTSFLNENVAIVMAAVFIHQHKLPLFVAFGSLYGGVVTGDVLIYLLGRAARRATALRRFLANDKLQQAQIRVQKNRIVAIAFCRVIPGLLFSTFTACGWFGITFVQFFVPALITSSLYTALMLLLVIKFGNMVVRLVGNLGWYLLLAVALLLALRSFLRICFHGAAARKSTPAPVVQLPEGTHNP